MTARRLPGDDPVPGAGSRAARRLPTLLLVAALLAAACGDDGAPGPDAADPSSASGAGSSGGAAVDDDAVVRLAYAGPINTLDPHRVTIPTQDVYLPLIYGRPFEVDADGVVVPQLAEASEFSDDGASFEVTMRSDATFHDGSPVDAAALAASIERGRTLDDSTVTALLEGITDVEVVDDFTARLALDGVGAQLPTILTTNAGAIMNPAVVDDPSVDLDRAPPAGAGSGPFVVTASEPNVETTYERAPSYWDPGAGRLARLTITFVADPATRLSGLQAGDFDLVQLHADAVTAAQDVAQDGALEVLTVPAATRDLLINTELGDLADPDLRRAVSLAIDRDDIGPLAGCEPHAQLYPEGHWAHLPGRAAPSTIPRPPYVLDSQLYVPICRAVQGWGYTVPLADLGSTPGLAGVLPVLTRLAVTES